MTYKALVDIVPGDQIYKGDLFSEKDWEKAGGDKKDLDVHVKLGNLEVSETRKEKKNVVAREEIHIES